MKAYYILLLGLVLLGCGNQSNKQEEKSDDESCMIYTLSDIDISLKYDKADTPLIKDLIDVYNGFNLLNSIHYDIELWVRYDTNVQEDAIEKIDCSIIHNDSIKTYACNYKNRILALLSDTALQDSIKLEKIGIEYSTAYTKLADRCHTTYYKDFSEDTYNKTYDPKNIIQDYDSIFSLRGTDDVISIAYLKYLANQAKSFDEKCIYTLEYAHTIVKDSEHPAIERLEHLMKSKKYSIYLHEIWRTWRCLLQECYGPSKDSEIPNDLYNRMRVACAQTVLEYIAQHPDDKMAINQFILLSSARNIERYGAYPYGNQNVLEHIIIFYEQHKDLLEGDEEEEEAYEEDEEEAEDDFSEDLNE